MRDLLMIVPTRGRPGNTSELIEAWTATTSRHADLLIAVDDDDPDLDGYRALGLPEAVTPLGGQIRMTVGPRERLGGTLNTLSHRYAPHYRALGFLGDDHRPRTRHFDAALIGALDRLHTGIVYGDDLFQGPNLPTAVAMTSDIVTTLGYMCPGGLVHMYLDNAWKAWGEGIGRLAYLPHVVIEHLHPHAGKGTTDDRYTEVWDLMGPDEQRWQTYRQHRLALDIGLLRDHLNQGGAR